MNMSKILKKDTKWSILELGQFDVSGLEEEISKFDLEWKIDTSRQDNNYTHSNTNMYQICYTDYDWSPGSSIVTNQVNNLKTPKAIKELLDIYNKLEYYYEGKIIRCEIVKMLKNTKIPKHVDGGPLLYYSRRVHVPVITNEKITFTVMDNTIHMKRGGWYEINNQLPHSVNNETDIDRVHIIIDVLPDNMKG